MPQYQPGTLGEASLIPKRWVEDMIKVQQVRNSGCLESNLVGLYVADNGLLAVYA